MLAKEVVPEHRMVWMDGRREGRHEAGRRKREIRPVVVVPEGRRDHNVPAGQLKRCLGVLPHGRLLDGLGRRHHLLLEAVQVAQDVRIGQQTAEGFVSGRVARGLLGRWLSCRRRKRDGLSRGRSCSAGCLGRFVLLLVVVEIQELFVEADLARVVGRRRDGFGRRFGGWDAGGRLLTEEVLKVLQSRGQAHFGAAQVGQVAHDERLALTGVVGSVVKGLDGLAAVHRRRGRGCCCCCR